MGKGTRGCSDDAGQCSGCRGEEGGKQMKVRALCSAQWPPPKLQSHTMPSSTFYINAAAKGCLRVSDRTRLPEIVTVKENLRSKKPL